MINLLVLNGIGLWLAWPFYTEWRIGIILENMTIQVPGTLFRGNCNAIGV